jgi:hypothetical protein
MWVMSPSAGTGAGGMHVELCVPNENHRAYFELMFSLSDLFCINIYEGHTHLFIMLKNVFFLRTL